METESFEPIIFEPLTPALAGVYREVNKFHAAPLSSLCGYWLKFCMQGGSVLFPTFSVKGDGSSLKIDLIQRDGTLREATALFDADCPTVLHPLRGILQQFFDLFNFRRSDFTLLFCVLPAKPQSRAWIDQDISPSHCLLLHCTQDTQFSQRSIPTASSGSFLGSPAHVFVAKLIRHLIRVNDSLYDKKGSNPCPCVMVACSRFGIIVVVVDPTYYPFGKQRATALITLLLFSRGILRNHRSYSSESTLMGDTNTTALVRPRPVRLSVADVIERGSLFDEVTSHESSSAQFSKSSNKFMIIAIETNRKQGSVIPIECPWFESGWSHLLIYKGLRKSSANSSAKGVANE